MSLQNRKYLHSSATKDLIGNKLPKTPVLRKNKNNNIRLVVAAADNTEQEVEQSLL